jgi:hypothetical protein
MGYVLSALSLIAIFTFRVCWMALKSSTGVSVKIRESFRWAYKEFGSAVPAPINDPGLRQAVDRIYRLHEAVSQLSTFATCLRRNMVCAGIALSGLILLITMRLLMPDGSSSAISKACIVVPSLFSVVQIALLISSIAYDNGIDKLNSQLDDELKNYESL